MDRSRHKGKPTVAVEASERSFLYSCCFSLSSESGGVSHRSDWNKGSRIAGRLRENSELRFRSSVL